MFVTYFPQGQQRYYDSIQLICLFAYIRFSHSYFSSFKLLIFPFQILPTTFNFCHSTFAKLQQYSIMTQFLYHFTTALHSKFDVSLSTLFLCFSKFQTQICPKLYISIYIFYFLYSSIQSSLINLLLQHTIFLNMFQIQFRLAVFNFQLFTP